MKAFIKILNQTLGATYFILGGLLWGFVFTGIFYFGYQDWAEPVSLFFYGLSALGVAYRLLGMLVEAIRTKFGK